MLRSRILIQARTASRLTPSIRSHSLPPIPRRQASTSAPRTNIPLNASIAAAILAAAAAAYYYETSSSSTTSSNPEPAGGDTFQINLGSGQRRQSHTFTRLSNSACEDKLRKHEDGQIIGREGNPVVKWDRNWLASNEPCEDRSAVDVVQRVRSSRDMKPSWGGWISASSTTTYTDTEPTITPIGGGSKDLVLFSMIDGHGGWATSELLSKVLHPTLTLSLASLQAGIVPGNSGGWLSGILDKVNPAKWVGGSIWTQDNVMKAISSA